MVQTWAEVPPIPDSIQNLYMDFETKSGDPKLDSLNPWHHCYLHGAALKFDNDDPFYLPSELGNVWEYVQQVLNRTKRWVNHNIKYDMHVAVNDGKCKIPENLDIFCTLVGAKLVNSDRFNYALDKLSTEWLFEDINEYEYAFKQFLFTPKGIRYNKDYGQIPQDLIAPYAGQDVITVAKLAKYIEENLDSRCERVFEVEKKLTKELFKIEQQGLKLDLPKLLTDGIIFISRLDEIKEKIHSISGLHIEPHISNDLYDLFILHYGLPVVEYTEPTKTKPNGSPSFGKKALSIYKRYTKAPTEVVNLVAEYKNLHKLVTGFIFPYANLQKDGYIHGMFNQCVRTGRMSMNDPNMQQAPGSVKVYFIPEEGCYIVSIDLSQIEYRIITHYTKETVLIEAYNNDPKTDYHSSISGKVGVPRKEAKTVNFLSGYGGGVAVLASNLEASEEYVKSFDDIDKFRKKCYDDAKNLMKAYHDGFPSLKRTIKDASKVLNERGYLINLFGRRRDMPTRVYSNKHNRWYDISYRAFNNASQSTAADFMKFKTLEIQEFIKNTGITLRNIVHDDWIFNWPKDEIHLLSKVQEVINRPIEGIGLRVPIYCDAKLSDKNWGECQ